MSIAYALNAFCAYAATHQPGIMFNKVQAHQSIQAMLGRPVNIDTVNQFLLDFSGGKYRFGNWPASCQLKRGPNGLFYV